MNTNSLNHLQGFVNTLFQAIASLAVRPLGAHTIRPLLPNLTAFRLQTRVIKQVAGKFVLAYTYQLKHGYLKNRDWSPGARIRNR